MRKSDVFFLCLGGGAVLLALSALDAEVRGRAALAALQQRAALVAELDLTDLSLFTEARYTRHLSQADLHSAFQDHPVGLEHFPSGSLVSPPVSLRERHELRTQATLSD